jgi:general L-amino acid transport system permease protein
MIAWLRANLFSGPLNTAITLALLAVLAWLVPPLLDWLVVDAVAPGAAAAACRGPGAGACWPVIHEKLRFILFGTYPYDQQWRAALSLAVIVMLLLASCDRRLWGRGLALLWPAGSALVAILMWGGIAGLQPVTQARWGGLPLTLILSVAGLVLAFPLGILLALARADGPPVIRGLAVAVIELVRGVPLISILFMASVMLPLFLPAGVTIDKLLRALAGLVLFAAAYLAEVIRGGLQSVGRGQHEAAAALGLGYWRATALVVLPQALRQVIPPLVNTFIGFFKDTSLVVIIGLFDLLATAKAALVEPAWRLYYKEVYLVVALIYFLFCYALSRYSRSLERLLNRDRRTAA